MYEKTEFHSTCYIYMGSVLLQKIRGDQILSLADSAQ